MTARSLNCRSGNQANLGWLEQSQGVWNRRAKLDHFGGAGDDDVSPYGNLVKSGAVKVVGAVYDVGTAGIKWLPVSEVDKILKMVEASPNRETNPLAP